MFQIERGSDCFESNGQKVLRKKKWKWKGRGRVGPTIDNRA